MSASAALPAPPTHQRRKAERPQELLDAALSLFVEKGFAASKAEEVAARAGVSKGTLYLYYPSKEDLLKAVIRAHLSSEIAAGAAEAAAHGGSSAELLGEVLRNWWLRVYHSPASGVFKLVITEVRNFPEIAELYQREVVEAGQRLVGDIIRQGIERGEFRPVPVESAVHSVVLPLVMLCLHKHSLGACAPVPSLTEPADFVADHFALLLRGLMVDPAKAPDLRLPVAPAAAPAEPPTDAAPACPLQRLGAAARRLTTRSPNRKTTP